jgi:ketosteroid isomerase-like protein
MQCAGVDKNSEDEFLDFRLTIGFKKIDGQWWFEHEHHSLPAV